MHFRSFGNKVYCLRSTAREFEFCCWAYLNSLCGWLAANEHAPTTEKALVAFQGIQHGYKIPQEGHK